MQVKPNQQVKLSRRELISGLAITPAMVAAANAAGAPAPTEAIVETYERVAESDLVFVGYRTFLDVDRRPLNPTDPWPTKQVAVYARKVG